MKLALNLAAILSIALIAAPAAAQRGGSPGGGSSLGDSGRFAGSVRGTVDTGRIASREVTRVERGDNHHARRRWNAANDTGTRIRRGNQHARRRWNAANGNNR